VALVVASLFIRRNRKQNAASNTVNSSISSNDIYNYSRRQSIVATVTDLQTQQVETAIIIIKDQSLEEVVLNADPSLLHSSSKFYEHNKSPSLSSSSSCSSSPYSSINSSPDSLRREAFQSSPSVSLETDADKSTFSLPAHHRKKRGVASSRLLQSLDSPYFVKQGAFDSPLHTSQELTQNPLHTSQEINQHNKNPFDSPSVLHVAMQRAALQRANQQQQKRSYASPALYVNHQLSTQGISRSQHKKRRASLGAFQYVARRSSLVGTSSHTVPL